MNSQPGKKLQTSLRVLAVIALVAIFAIVTFVMWLPAIVAKKP